MKFFFVRIQECPFHILLHFPCRLVTTQFAIGAPHAPQQNGELQVCYIEVIWQLARKMKEINVIHIILEVPLVDLKRIITKIMVITFLFVYD